MKSRSDYIRFIALVSCVASATYASASHRSLPSRICCIASAALMIAGIILKLREGGAEDA